MEGGDAPQREQSGRRGGTPRPGTPGPRLPLQLAAFALVAAGMWGFMRPPVFGLLPSAPHYNVLYLVTGSLALYFGFANLPEPAVARFRLAFGTAFALLGTAGFLGAPWALHAPPLALTQWALALATLAGPLQPRAPDRDPAREAEPPQAS